MSDVSASNSSSMSLRAPSRTSVLVRSSASVPCLAPIANCSANCPSCSAGGILVIGLGLLGVSLSGFSPTTDGSPDHSLFTDRLSHHPLTVESVRPAARCPLCGRVSHRKHSHYTRFLMDLPADGRTVNIHLTVRRLRCTNPDCRRHVFAQRFPHLIRPHACPTER